MNASVSVSLLYALMLPTGISQAASLKPVDVTDFFVSPDQQTVLTWTSGGADRVTDELEYTIHDYAGQLKHSGSADLNDKGAVQIVVKLERGFYELEFSGNRQRFGVVSLPAAAGDTDPYFSIDGALSWLVPDGPVRHGLVKNLKRCGIAMVRERLNWAAIQPTEGQWDWEGGASRHHYDTLRSQLAEESLPALEVFHNAPAWTGLVEKYPDDLAKAAQSWRNIGLHWQHAWGALEVWNEPDIFFGGNLPADQYLAVVKTLAWARRQAGIQTTFVGGVLAHFNPAFQDCSARNGILELVDVVSFHTYGRAEKMEELVTRFRRWAADRGHDAKPFWITECGRPWKRGAARPEKDEGQISALDITMKAVEARACGVERYFAFVYPYYEERTSNFGMMGRLATPLRSMAAYAQCADRLKHFSYQGDLSVLDKRLRRARVFARGDDAVIVLYSGEIGRQHKVDLGLPVLRAEGIDGRTLPIKEPGVVSVPDGLTYVFVKLKAIGDQLRADTGAMLLFRSAAGQRRPTKPASPVVARYQADKSLVAATSEGYRLLEAPQPGTVFTFRVFNLGEEPRNLSVVLSCGPGRDAVADSQQRQVSIAGHSSADVRWAVDVPKLLGELEHATLSVRARDAAGTATGSVSIDLGTKPSKQ